MPVSRKRKNRGKGAGARERQRRAAQHNAVVRERIRGNLGCVNDPSIIAAASILIPSLVRRAGKLW